MTDPAAPTIYPHVMGGTPSATGATVSDGLAPGGIYRGLELEGRSGTIWVHATGQDNDWAWAILQWQAGRIVSIDGAQGYHSIQEAVDAGNEAVNNHLK